MIWVSILVNGSAIPDPDLLHGVDSGE
jgi:hypothetical protein